MPRRRDVCGAHVVRHRRGRDGLGGGPDQPSALGWDAGRPAASSRTIKLDFAPVDLAVAPDGTIYVSGVKPGAFVGLRLYAYRPNGQRLWNTPLLTPLFNSHVRIGPDGVPYSENPQGWAPVVGGGQPLDPEEQLQRVQPNQPLVGATQLVVEATRISKATTWRRSTGGWR